MTISKQIIDKIKPSGSFKIVDGADVNYVSTVSGFTQTDVDGAINELASRTVTVESDTSEPTGFVDAENATISFNNANRTFSLTPSTSFSFYIKGKKTTISSTLTLQISNVEGLHYLYINPSGQLEEITSFDMPTLFRNNCYVAVLYWDSTNNKQIYLGSEKHGCVMDWASHSYLHTNFGARYISGLSLGNFNVDGDGSNNNMAQFSTTSGSIADEDITHIINGNSLPANIPIYFRDGLTNVRRKEPDNFPLIGKNDITTTSRIKFNLNTAGVWSLSQVDNNNFTLMHYFATNDINNPIIGWVGTSQYTDRASARNNAYTEILTLTGLPFAEFVPIASVIFKTDSYTNTPNAIIVSTDTGGNYIDFRTTKNSGTSAVTQEHNNLLNRDVINSHPSTAISLNTSTFDKNLDNTVVNVQLLAEKVDELNLASNAQQKFYYFSNTSNALTLSTIKAGLSTYQYVTDFVYTNNDFTLNAPASSGNYFLYAIVPEGTNVDRMLYNSTGSTFVNILSTPVGQIIADGINHNVYVSQQTMPLILATKTVRFVVYPATISYVETETPDANELIMGNSQRNRATGSNIVLTGGLIPNNKVQSGVPSIENVSINSATTSDHLYVDAQNTWNAVKGKRLVVTQVSNLSQWYLNLPTLLTGRFVQVNEWVQVVILTNKSLYPQSRARIDTFSVSENFDIGGSQIDPTVNTVYQITYTGQTIGGSPFWKVTQFAYGSSGQEGDTQTIVVQPNLVYRDYGDLSINLDGGLDIGVGTKLQQNVFRDFVTITKPSSSILNLDFTNVHDVVQFTQKHSGDINYPNITIDQYMQTISFSNAYSYLTTDVMNTSYTSGQVDEPISDQDYDITQITYVDDTHAVFRIDSGTTPINMNVGSVLTLASNTGVNVFNSARPISIQSISNQSGYTNLTCVTTTPVVSEGDGTTTVAYFKRRLFWKTSSFTLNPPSHWIIAIQYYIDPTFVNQAVIQDNWYLPAYTYNWFDAPFTNAVVVAGDLNVNGNIASNGTVSGANMKLGNKLLANSTTPTTDNDVLTYDTTTDSLIWQQPNIANTVVQTSPQDYNDTQVNIGSTNNKEVALTAYNEKFIDLIDRPTESSSSISGLTGTIANFYGGGIMSDDSYAGVLFSGTGYFIKKCASGFTNFSNTLGSYLGVAYCACTNGNDVFTLSPSTAPNYFQTSRYTASATLYSTFGNVGTLTQVGTPQLVAFSPDATKLAVFSNSTGENRYQIYNNTGWSNIGSSFASASILVSPNTNTIPVAITVLNNGTIVGLNDNGDLFQLTGDGTNSILVNNFVAMDGSGTPRLGIKMISSTVYITAMGDTGAVSTYQYTGSAVLKKYSIVNGINNGYIVGMDSSLNVVGIGLNSAGTTLNGVTFVSDLVINAYKPVTFNGGIRDTSNSVGTIGQLLVRDNTASGFSWQTRDGVGTITTSTALNYTQQNITAISSTAITITLPDAATLPYDGMQLAYVIQNSGTGTGIVTVQVPNSAFSGFYGTTFIIPLGQSQIFYVKRDSGSGNKYIIGAPRFYNGCMARVKSGTQIIAPTTDSLVLFENTDSRYDFNGAYLGLTYLNGTFTNTSGRPITVAISYSVLWASNNSGNRFMWLRYNGDATRRLAYDTRLAINGDVTVNDSCVTITMQNNDYFQLYCYSTSNANVDLGVSQGGTVQGQNCMIQIVRIS